MNPRSISKLLSLSLALSAPAALADWRDDGAFRLTQDDGYGDDYKDSDSGDSVGEAKGAGFSLGLRAGYGVPFGKASGEGTDDGAELSDLVSGVIPLQVDAGYFINSNLYLGGFFQYGIGQYGGEECPDEVNCSASQIRFGVDLAYHFAPSASINPWVGVGVGYERIAVNISSDVAGVDAEATTSARGIEFGHAQGGLDFRLSDTISVGPFATFTVAQYSTASISSSGVGPDIDESADIDEKAFHFWLYGGLRLQARF
ncbi:outer membrane beta-barrel protein [Pyxidicoccus fallax]|uniref:Porin family protein n=1 Tax=Pyxidicoccus fallax TaxID=394095 RepID=A0A848LRR0_9BACT|nr:outer membrane beta-barrel protein [Pyxidicoccus fallax]NMO20320.1 porin family protein [Pyxidicoccus fallax]NPC81076.1 outer membrane beta-barrel protein [Pyxidicoccus fallax]